MYWLVVVKCYHHHGLLLIVSQFRSSLIRCLPIKARCPVISIPAESFMFEGPTRATFLGRSD